MDNQQAISLSWLAGFLDGDGSISIAKRNRGKNVNMKPYVVFSNSDPLTIEEVAKILTDNHVGHYVSWTKQRGLGTKPRGAVSVFGFKRVLSLLELLIPHIRGNKKQQAEITKAWIEYRLENGGTGKHSSYTDYDGMVYAKVAGLKREQASETIRLGYSKG